MIVAMPAALRSARHIRPAITAGICNSALGLVRRLRQRSGLAFPSRARPTREFAPLPVTTDPVLRRRNMRVDRRLARLASSASSSVIRATSRSIISCCCASSASLSASLKPRRGGNGICRVNQIPTPAATFSATPVSNYPS